MTLLLKEAISTGKSFQASAKGKNVFNDVLNRRLYSGRAGPGQSRQAELEMQRDFILSVLEAQPSARDSRFYLKNFDPAAAPHRSKPSLFDPISESDKPAFPMNDQETPTTAFSSTLPIGFPPLSSASITSSTTTTTEKSTNELADELLAHPASRHTALVKVQGPFTDRQMESIAEGMVYLKKLGLVSIIVMDNENWNEEEDRIVATPEDERRRQVVALRERMKAETLQFSNMLEAKGGAARPLLEGVLCVKGAAFEDTLAPIASTSEKPYDVTHTDLFVDSLSGIRNAVRRGEIPVIPPMALDQSCFSICVSANDALRAISHGLADAERQAGLRYEADARLEHDVDLTPVRIMIINREGGIPSPAREGDPHLSINLESEFDYINQSFIWQESHPTALSNLALIRDCLADLPRTASAILVSHRSPRSLIANLITNKPAHSPSLHHDLIPRRNIQHQPTIIRRGLPIRVMRSMNDLDEDKLTHVLEESFGKTLDREPFYDRLRRDLDFCIVAGDYQAVAIVTNERDPTSGGETIAYLDKFAVLPSLQGDGTVDFLWGALRDESWGLGLVDALNPNVGGLGGQGIARDLVWRSRSNNPVNKWYFDRSNGFFKIPPPRGSPVGFALFWCEAEDKAAQLFRNVKEGKEGIATPGKMKQWAKVIGAIPSCWK
ncbi:acetyl-CoA:L-glutamate N-acetyltransferase [Sporobolomyces salmoneus]|uniref:acetyl-CoA:L-glutamate N-acetyltransferase n=1 Tax=Sporobolomyces salmoneus TaxID=183962 RepID=UPI00316D78A3